MIKRLISTIRARSETRERYFDARFPANLKGELLPFTFEGINEPAQCYVRYESASGGMMILVGQLPDYTGTDVTTGFLDIVKAFVEFLLPFERIQYIDMTRSLLAKLGETVLGLDERPITESERRGALIDKLIDADWIVYYPPGVGLLDTEAYALVRIGNMGPKFNYRHKQVIADHIGVPAASLTVDTGRLHAYSETLKQADRTPH
jgi:hypothetical protein